MMVQKLLDEGIMNIGEHSSQHKAMKVAGRNSAPI